MKKEEFILSSNNHNELQSLQLTLCDLLTTVRLLDNNNITINQLKDCFNQSFCIYSNLKIIFREQLPKIIEQTLNKLISGFQTMFLSLIQYSQKRQAQNNSLNTKNGEQNIQVDPVVNQIVEQQYLCKNNQIVIKNNRLGGICIYNESYQRGIDKNIQQNIKFEQSKVQKPDYFQEMTPDQAKKQQQNQQILNYILFRKKQQKLFIQKDSAKQLEEINNFFVQSSRIALQFLNKSSNNIIKTQNGNQFSNLIQRAKFEKNEYLNAITTKVFQVLQLIKKNHKDLKDYYTAENLKLTQLKKKNIIQYVNQSIQTTDISQIYENIQLFKFEIQQKQISHNNNNNNNNNNLNNSQPNIFERQYFQLLKINKDKEIQKMKILKQLEAKIAYINKLQKTFKQNPLEQQEDIKRKKVERQQNYKILQHLQKHKRYKSKRLSSVNRQHKYDVSLKTNKQSTFVNFDKKHSTIPHSNISQENINSSHNIEQQNRQIASRDYKYEDLQESNFDQDQEENSQSPLVFRNSLKKKFSTYKNNKQGSLNGQKIICKSVSLNTNHYEDNLLSKKVLNYHQLKEQLSKKTIKSIKGDEKQLSNFESNQEKLKNSSLKLKKQNFRMPSIKSIRNQGFKYTKINSPNRQITQLKKIRFNDQVSSSNKIKSRPCQNLKTNQEKQQIKHPIYQICNQFSITLGKSQQNLNYFINKPQNQSSISGQKSQLFQQKKLQKRSPFKGKILNFNSESLAGFYHLQQREKNKQLLKKKKKKKDQNYFSKQIKSYEFNLNDLLNLYKKKEDKHCSFFETLKKQCRNQNDLRQLLQFKKIWESENGNESNCKEILIKKHIKQCNEGPNCPHLDRYFRIFKKIAEENRIQLKIHIQNINKYQGQQETSDKNRRSKSKKLNLPSIHQ